MYQLALDIRIGKVFLNKITVEKETNKCFFLNTRTTIGCIYRFEKDRLNKVEYRFGVFSIFFEDINSFNIMKDLVLEEANKHYTDLLDKVKLVNDGINQLHFMEVQNEYKEAKQETGE